MCIFVLLSTPHTCIPMPQRCTASPTPRPRRKPTVIAREVDPIPILRPKWPAKMASQFFLFLFFGRAHSGPHAGYGSVPIYEEIPAETTFRAFSRQKRGFSPSSMHPMFPISSLSFTPPPGHGYGKSSRKARPLVGVDGLQTRTLREVVQVITVTCRWPV